MPTNINGLNATPQTIKADAPGLKNVLDRASTSDVANVIASLANSGNVAVLTKLAQQPGASPILKELVDLLTGSPLLSSPRQSSNKELGSVFSKLQNDIYSNNRTGVSKGFVARFESVELSQDQKSITLTPHGAGGGNNGGLESLVVSSTAGGVFNYELQGRYSFRWGKMEQRSLRDIVNNGAVVDKQDAFKKLGNVNLDFETSVLALETDDPDDPVMYLAALPRQPGDETVKMAIICKGCKVDTVDERGNFIGGPGGLEKPVVYFYPEQRTSIEVKVEVEGKFTAQYPKPCEGKDTWRFIAETDGKLYDPRSARNYSYLFWEADPTKPMAIELQKAHCIKGSEGQAFLENLAKAHAFNDAETTDFVSYWLGRVEAHPYCMIQVMEPSEYERYAKMTVTPTPDTVNRLFILVQGVAEIRPVGAPALPQLARKGFTVVEWGGAEV